YTGNVTVAIGTNPGGGTLSGTKTVAAVAGVATFSSLTIDKSGTGYTLTAAANNLGGATSSTFNITPAAVSQLGFTVEPSNAMAGAMIAPAVKVAGQDAFGNTVTSFTGSVTIAITPGSGTSGAALSGITMVNASSGIATFSNLSIDKTGADYHLTASSGALTPATSAIFAITSGAATHLTFDQQPATTVAGSPMTVSVTARDALENPVKTFTGNVTVAIAVNPGGGTLGGTKILAAVQGTATFSTLTIDKAASGYRLSATAGGLAPDTSTAFAITAGAATKLAFTVQPAATLANAVITPAVEVTAQDAFGNTVTSFTGNVAIAITPGTGTAGAVLTGLTPVAAVAGVSRFSDLSINLAGTGYKLTASAGGLSAATSVVFNIN
ncbi:MAG TPA: hypothetical protein VLB49_10435, partial [Gemmatimonadales bacterium]|nr:hypothetical protein [Gemmatimonadales bacterium]